MFSMRASNPDDFFKNKNAFDCISSMTSIEPIILDRMPTLNSYFL